MGSHRICNGSKERLMRRDTSSTNRSDRCVCCVLHKAVYSRRIDQDTHYLRCPLPTEARGLYPRRLGRATTFVAFCRMRPRVWRREVMARVVRTVQQDLGPTQKHLAMPECGDGMLPKRGASDGHKSQASREGCIGADSFVISSIYGDCGKEWTGKWVFVLW